MRKGDGDGAVAPWALFPGNAPTLMGRDWSWVITHSQLQCLGVRMDLETSHGPSVVPNEPQDSPEPENGVGEVNSLEGSLQPGGRASWLSPSHSFCPFMSKGHFFTSWTHRAFLPCSRGRLAPQAPGSADRQIHMAPCRGTSREWTQPALGTSGWPCKRTLPTHWAPGVA